MFIRNFITISVLTALTCHVITAVSLGNPLINSSTQGSELRGVEASERRLQASKGSNETKPSASYDSFRVSTPENNRDGTLLLDSYHDFRTHHGHYNGHHYNGNHNPHYYHHRHHRPHHYPDELGSGEITENEDVVDGEEAPIDEGPVEPAVNGELIDPESADYDKPISEESGVEDPASDVEEIPIDDVPGEPVNGEEVSGELKYQPGDYSETDYNNRHHDPTRYNNRYPIMSQLPPTHFKCSHIKHSGYPDVEARCQVILPGNRYGRWEILHFLHKSSPQKSNAVIFLDHGSHSHQHGHGYHGHGYHGYNHHHPEHHLYDYHPRANHFPHLGHHHPDHHLYDYHPRAHHFPHLGHHYSHHRHHSNGHYYPRANYVEEK